MKRIALGLAAVVLSAAAAHADPFAVAYGNTVTQTMPDGNKTTIYVNADKTWNAMPRTARSTRAPIPGRTTPMPAFTLTDPAPADAKGATNCSEIKGDHKVGDTWTEPMGEGKNITMSITAGR